MESECHQERQVRDDDGSQDVRSDSLFYLYLTHLLHACRLLDESQIGRICPLQDRRVA